MACTAGSPTVLIGHSSSVWTPSFTPSGSHIATCSSDETVRVWSLAPELVRGHQVACLTGHKGVVRGCDFSPDSTLLASCSWDKCIHIYTASDFAVSVAITLSVLKGVFIMPLHISALHNAYLNRLHFHAVEEQVGGSQLRCGWGEVFSERGTPGLLQLGRYHRTLGRPDWHTPCCSPRPHQSCCKLYLPGRRVCSSELICLLDSLSIPIFDPEMGLIL